MKAEDKPDPDKKDVFKFDWQRNAPRAAAHCKRGSQLWSPIRDQRTVSQKCMKVPNLGPSAHRQTLPRYGKAQDEEEPAVVINEKKLIEDMRTTDRLQFTSLLLRTTERSVNTLRPCLRRGDGIHSQTSCRIYSRASEARRQRSSTRASEKKVTSKRTKSPAPKSERTKKLKSSKSDKRKKYVRTKSEGGAKSETISEKTRLIISIKSMTLFSDIGPPGARVPLRPDVAFLHPHHHINTCRLAPSLPLTISDNSKLNNPMKGSSARLTKFLELEVVETNPIQKKHPVIATITTMMRKKKMMM